MLYQATIITPVNTLLASPKKTIIDVSNGLVYKIEVVFPSGSAGLSGVAIFDGSLQLWPSSVGEFFVGDANVISFDDVYLKQVAPFVFTIFTYNLDDTYEHKVYVRIGLVTKDIFMARFLPHLSYEFFEKMLVNLAAEQANLTKQQKETILNSSFDWLKEQGQG